MSDPNRLPIPPNALENRCAIVTGASRGLGREIARSYLEAGASVMLCARDGTRLDAAASELARHARPGQSLLALPADISRAADVARLVDAAFARFGRLDILVNNAGVAGPCGAVETVAWEEWVRTLEINLLGAVLLTRAVLPHLKRAERAKIIQLSGGGATRPLPMRSAYAASKAGVVRFIETLAEELRSCRIDVNAIAPGALDTRMLDELIAAGPERLGREQYEHCLQLKRDGSVPLERGAELAVFLGSKMSDGITGKLLSAVWDPWRTLPQYLDDLNGTDVYTLRRIAPGERGLPWADGA